MGLREEDGTRKQAGVIKFGGITLMVSGILFLAQYLFVLPVPTPRQRMRI